MISLYNTINNNQYSSPILAQQATPTCVARFQSVIVLFKKEQTFLLAP